MKRLKVVIRILQFLLLVIMGVFIVVRYASGKLTLIKSVIACINVIGAILMLGNICNIQTRNNR